MPQFVAGFTWVLLSLACAASCWLVRRTVHLPHDSIEYMFLFAQEARGYAATWERDSWRGLSG
ncbi:MAG TPA: hypothetical protein VFV60_04310, partial [bacterium]|nr:hypothetical protein [bacterium]